ncbi:MAG: hypothetical protein ACI8P0_005633 [Planctomycetaceae bacterium]|jgi:hypothetical protein
MSIHMFGEREGRTATLQQSSLQQIWRDNPNSASRSDNSLLL